MSGEIVRPGEGHDAVTAGATVRLGLPWDKPPLTLNDRFGHRAQHAAVVAKIRRDAGWVAKAARLGRHDHVTVELHYQPQRRGRRDADNLVATLKPVADALVDAGLVVDDDPAHMTKLMPVIDTPTAGQRRGRLWINITPSAPRDTPTPRPRPSPRAALPHAQDKITRPGSTT